MILLPVNVMSCRVESFHTFRKKRNDKTNDGCDTCLCHQSVTAHNQKSIINYARKYKKKEKRK